MTKKILFYDDDSEILSLCLIILSKTNYIIETRVFCDDIIEDVRSIGPDLIIMDLWIPKIGGEKAITLLKQNDETKHIPILLFSANADLPSISKKLNADGYIEKPFAIAEFTKTINSMFKSEHSQE
ncbi:MAG: response regulator [Bacteroidetes bacterium]|nr:response regulator [Bacteroidota bacterium]